MKVLVTSFKPFNNCVNNYSSEVLKYINATDKYILDVVYDKCYEELSNKYDLSKYDLIISNPPIRAGKSVVHSIICGARNYLNEGGEMRCVIQQKQGAPSAIKALNEVFSTVEIIDKSKGYWIISAKR